MTDATFRFPERTLVGPSRARAHARGHRPWLDLTAAALGAGFMAVLATGLLAALGASVVTGGARGALAGFGRGEKGGAAGAGR